MSDQLDLFAPEHDLPEGFRDRVSRHLFAAMEPPAGADEAGATMARCLHFAAKGIPNSSEQAARWQRLGIA